ncbi:MAG: C39 family peptidase [Christensenellales bacterium]|nr:C39 family peptidase [Christensenellales bacterium]
MLNTLPLHEEQLLSVKLRLCALNYDVGPSQELDSTTDWALRWFIARNGLTEPTPHQLMEALNHPDAVRGTNDTPVQFYSMKDPVWADYPYKATYTTVIERMGNSSCGPTSMAMAVSTLLGRAVLPPVLADWANANGYRDPYGIDGTHENFFVACAARYGLSGEILYVGEDIAQALPVYNRLASALKEGQIVIANVVGGSPFTQSGHYLLLTSMENNQMSICDPNPNNADLPVFTREQWLRNRWSKLFVIIRKA